VERGLEDYGRLLEKYPNSPFADDARYAIGWTYFQQKKYDSAVKQFATLAQTWPKSDLAPGP